MTTNEEAAAQRLAEASRVATEELHKQGTPAYDARAHQRAVEFERKAADAAAAVQAAKGTRPS
ncbi:MAG: translation initiation factor 2 [Cellulomonas sp.]